MLPEGSSVFLLTLEKNAETLLAESREQIEKKLKSEGINWIPFKYKPFGLSVFFLWIRISFRLCRLVLKEKISVIHCWCTPAGAIGYFLAVILNRKLVIDSYEPHAEAMVENGTWNRNGIAFRLLFWLEKKQTKRADYIIGTTEGMRHYAKTKFGLDIPNFIAKPACVDLQLFDNSKQADELLRRDLGLQDKVVCVYAGKFGGIYLDVEVFDFIRVAINHWGDRFMFLILTGQKTSEIHGYCDRAGVDRARIVVRFIPHQEVVRYMQLADFALTPVKPVPTKRYCTPIKNGEYWALGLPVVIPANISDDSQIIQDCKIGAVLPSLTDATYKEAVNKIDKLIQQADVQIKIRSIAMRHRSFGIAKKVYEKVYSREGI
jgi:glycosyltransferase involved in cell wall biosynthesis